MDMPAHTATHKLIIIYFNPLLMLQYIIVDAKVQNSRYLTKKEQYNFPNLKKRVTFASGFADMAQLVEQRIRNAWVRGSSPLIGSNRKKECHLALFFSFPKIIGQLTSSWLS